MQKRKVIIIGGGLAGLSAAYRLSKDANFDIHLLEKNNYLGGRVHSCTINSQTIDVGGFLVYPWYKSFHKLIKDLNLTEELVKVPEVKDYYAGDAQSHNQYEEGFSLSFKDIIQIFVRIFPNPLTDSDPTEPELHAYQDLSIHDYLVSLNLDTEKTNHYLKAFDTYLQGYCYGPATEHKMAFMAATLFQNIFHGDVHSASYLRNGSKVLMDTLQTELEKRGVQIHLNCSLKSIHEKQLLTNQGEMMADEFIFCQTQTNVKYSNFITATISYTGNAIIETDAAWGSSFYKENAQKPFSILSIVNLKTLYTDKLAQHLNLNIKVNNQNQPNISTSDLWQFIKTEVQQLFKDIQVTAIVNRVDWEKTMPIADENFIESVRQKQGLKHRYYAGDFMGCPAMETAIQNGIRAAEKLIADTKE